jgi:hypothetical protein
MTRRWKIVLGCAVALVALRMALPTILARVIQGQASARLGRAVELENVDLFLLAGRITLEELLIGPPLAPEAEPAPIDRKSALLHWPHALVDVGWLGLFAGELKDNRLEPLIVARPEDPRPPSEAPQPPEPELEEVGEVPPPDPVEQESGWSLRLEELVLTDHAFFLVDAADPSQPPIEFSLAELTVGDVVFAGGQVSVGLRARRRRHRQPPTSQPPEPRPPTSASPRSPSRTRSSPFSSTRGSSRSPWTSRCATPPWHATRAFRSISG